VSFPLQILYSYDVAMVGKTVWARNKIINPVIQPITIRLVTEVGQTWYTKHIKPLVA
jgi:hypothetical protein